MRFKEAGLLGRLAGGCFLALTVAAVVGTPSLVLAVDGVIEINQASAEAGGVTAGDSAGFPVTISEPGSYRLTGNLTIPDYYYYAITITSDDVTLDLNGFAISGPVSCSGSGSSVVCSPSGAWHGINASGQSRTVVRNGTVRGFTSIGIFLGSYGRVEHVVATSNGGSGINAGDRSVITDVTSASNGDSGIYLGNLARVTDSTVTLNRSEGVLCGNGCILRNNASRLNGLRGFYAGDYSTISNNVAESNEGNGIRAGNSAVVSLNSSSLNGASGGSQIYAGSASLVTGNTVRNASTSGYALSFLNATIGYSNNVIFAVGTGEVQNGTNLGQNLCTGSPCP
jgi:hypothetical protein